MSEKFQLSITEAKQKMKDGYIVESNYLGLKFFHCKERFVTDLNNVPFDELSEKDNDKKFRIDTRMFTTKDELKNAVSEGKVIEYDYSNGFKNNYRVVDFTKPLLTDDVCTNDRDFNHKEYNTIGYDSKLTNYRIKSELDIEKDRKLDFNESIDLDISRLQKIRELIDEVEEKSNVISRFFNNRSSAFKYEIIDREIKKLKESKLSV